MTGPYDQMTEDQAIDMLVRFDRKFGWVSAIVNRECAEQVAGPLTEEQWLRLSTSREWTRTLADAMTEGLLDVVGWAVHSVLHDLDDEAGS
jgi:hypothetical protein